MWVCHGRVAPVGYFNFRHYFTDLVRNYGRFSSLPLRPVCFNDGSHQLTFNLCNRSVSEREAEPRKT